MQSDNCNIYVVRYHSGYNNYPIIPLPPLFLLTPSETERENCFEISDERSVKEVYELCVLPSRERYKAIKAKAEGTNI